MALFEILPFIAALIFIVSAVIALLAPPDRKTDWTRPALICLAFLAFTLFAVFSEGPLGFWPNHTQDAWGNQVWFDLLIAIGIVWVLILPRAKAQNMKLPLWLIFIICTGCIGILAMLARLYSLENKSAQ